MIGDELRALDTSRPALRRFGWVVGGVLLLIGGIVLWRQGWTLSTASQVLFGVGTALVVLGTAVPQALRAVYRGWMALALILGFVMTRVLLTLVFFLVVTPIGLLMRLIGHDPMRRKPDDAAATYWIPKEPHDPSPKRLERYF